MVDVPWMPGFTDLVEHVDQGVLTMGPGLERNTVVPEGGRPRLSQLFGTASQEYLVCMSSQRGERGFAGLPRRTAASSTEGTKIQW